MRILDRYISRTIVTVFLCSIVIFFLLYLLIDSASNLDEFIDRKVPISIIIDYYITNIPIIIVQTAFYAYLISALLAYTNLHTNNEIIALRASGLNFFKIARPALILGLLLSAGVFYINENAVPVAQERIKQIRNENMILEIDRRRKKQSKIKNLTFYGLKNRLYYIDEFDPKTFEMTGVTIIGYDENQRVKNKIVAYRGTWTGIAWKLYKCQITQFAEAVNMPTKVKVYEEKLLDIRETPDDFLSQRINPEVMNIRQLKEYIGRFESSGAERAINNLKVDLYQKIAFPLGNIVIILFGLPLTLMVGRRKAQSFVALGIAIIIGFLYHLTNVVMLAFGKGGLFPPLVAVSLAPMAFLMMAWYLIRTRF